jgi:hypothetical protein
MDAAPGRGIDRAVLRQLASGRWARDHHASVITSKTGTGKTYLGCAFAQQACRLGMRAVYRCGELRLTASRAERGCGRPSVPPHVGRRAGRTRPHPARARARDPARRLDLLPAIGCGERPEGQPMLGKTRLRRSRSRERRRRHGAQRRAARGKRSERLPTSGQARRGDGHGRLPDRRGERIPATDAPS